jgi:hypothetical protein
MKNHFLLVVLFLSCIINLISCKTDKAEVFNEREFIKKLRITKIVGTTYPSKFGKIDSTNGFLSSIYTYDTNGYVIKSEVFYNDEFMRDFSNREVHFFTNNYQYCRTEVYDYKNSLKNIYIDSLKDDRYIQRKVFDEKNKLTDLIKYKYDSGNLIEILFYDSTGKLISKEVITYKDNKQVKSTTYNENNAIKNKTISEHYDNYNFSTSYNKEGKIEYKSKREFRNGLTTLWEYTSYSNENDSTFYKEEYTYQDSTLYKQKLKYRNNEIESAVVYTISKRE